ncbi:acyl-CoA thioesterase-1 [Pedobacter sp. CG_S7]|uniref:arylesterase n=1 Tax=Pedobacter sp. CG_S7 TaxID=3143930 RepID=UPI00339A54C0
MLEVNLIRTLVFYSVLMVGCVNNQKNETVDGGLNKSSADTLPMTSSASVKEENILFFGTSLTAGYGLDQSEAYPALIQKKIDSLKLPYSVINGGLSGETSAAGKNRIDWLLKQPIKVFVLELGANDGLRGVPVAETTANLQAIIDKVKSKYPDAKLILAGMEVPPNMGDKYASDFRDMFKKLAKKNKMVFVPFLLKGVGGVPKLNQNDGIHPTAKGQQILAENVWIKLEGVL